MLSRYLIPGHDGSKFPSNTHSVLKKHFADPKWVKWSLVSAEINFFWDLRVIKMHQAQSIVAASFAD